MCSEEEQLRADLSAYLDGELDEQRARQVEQYLDESEHAHRLLQDLRAVRESLSGLPRAAAPTDLSVAVGQEVLRRATLRSRAPQRSARVLRWVSRITASAAMIAVGAFAGRFFWNDGSTGSAPSNDASVTGTTLGGAIQEFKQHAAAKPVPQVAMVDNVELEALQALGYVGDGTTEAELGEVFAGSPAEPPAAALAKRDERGGEIDRLAAARPVTRDAIDGAPPQQPSEPPAGEAPAAIAAETPLLAGGAQNQRAAPAIRVAVVAQTPEQYGRLVAALEEWDEYGFDEEHAARLKRKRHAEQTAGVPLAAGGDQGRMRAIAGKAGRGGGASSKGGWVHPDGDTASDTAAEQWFAYNIEPARIEYVLQTLEQRAPDGVQVTMDFRPNELGRIREILAMQSSSYEFHDQYGPKTGLLTESEARREGQEAAGGRGGRQAGESNDRAVVEEDTDTLRGQIGDDSKKEGLRGRAPARRFKLRSPDEAIPNVAGLDTESQGTAVASQPAEEESQVVEGAPAGVIDPNISGAEHAAEPSPHALPRRVALEITILPPPSQDRHGKASTASQPSAGQEP